MMKLFKVGAAAVMAAALVACGGGGGFSGEPNGPSAQLRIFPPVATLSMPVGAVGATNIEVQGGRPPYVVLSSDPAISASLSADNFLVVQARQPGTSELTIVDQERKQVTISATVSVADLVSSVGTALTMTPGEVRTTSLRGGAGPFIASSSDNSVATATVSGSVVTITAQRKVGTVPILITDALGDTVNIQVTVTAEPVTTAPTSVTGLAGTSAQVSILGGVAPFGTVSSSNATIATASVSGSVLSINLLRTGTTNITFVDAAGRVGTLPVTVTSNVVRAVPASQSVLETQNTAVTFSISGGVTPYTPVMSVSDAPIATASISGSTLTVAVGTSGNRCVAANRAVPIDVYDANLEVQRVTLNIVDVPGAPTCP